MTHWSRIVSGLLVVLLLISNGYAHPGRTDANGGHYDRSTGEYHYHHGYPAHQHPGGICPYNFDDKTGQNSSTGGSSSVSGTSSSSKVSQNTNTIESNDEKEDKQDSRFQLSGIMVYAGIFGVYLLYRFIRLIYYILENRRRKKQQKELQQIERAELLRQYRGKSKQEIAHSLGMPSDVTIGDDGYPHRSEPATDTMDRYIVYVTQTGSAYHSRLSCCGYTAKKVNVVDVAQNYFPCSRCHPISENIDWYYEYRELLDKLETYQIDFS